jgi:hypothetical protein
MKTSEVPQDNLYLESTTMRDLYYAIDENGNYTQVSSVGWQPKNDALTLTWDSILEEADNIRNQVLAGTKSPLAYHMEKNLMTIPLLASYSGIPKKTIKAHMKPEEFAKATRETLNLYAKTLNISTEELLKV